MSLPHPVDPNYCAVCAYPLSGGLCHNCLRKEQEKSQKLARERDEKRAQQRQIEQQKIDAKKRKEAIAKQQRKDKANAAKTAVKTSKRSSNSDDSDSKTMFAIIFAGSATAAAYYYVFPMFDLFQNDDIAVALLVTSVVGFIAAQISSGIRKLTIYALIAAVLYFVYKFFIAQ